MTNSTQYINDYNLHSDVRSYKILSLDGDKGVAIEVKKNIVLKNEDIHQGGFSANISNLKEYYRDSNDIEEVGKPFEIIKKGEFWGIMKPKNFHEFLYEQLTISGRDDFRKNPLWTDTGSSFQYLEKTSKGKIKMFFKKLGKLSDTCEYFYDMNF